MAVRAARFALAGLPALATAAATVSLIGGLGCSGGLVGADDDDGGATPAPVTTPESSGAIEAAAWWGDVVLGASVEVGKCLAPQTDDRVTLGLCEVGTTRGLAYDPEALTLVTSSGLCLDAGGSVLVGATCRSDGTQRWIHDRDGRLRTRPDREGAWLCLEGPPPPASPRAVACNTIFPPEQRWAVGSYAPSVDPAALLTGLPSLQLPTGFVPVAAVGPRAVPLLVHNGVPVIVAGTVGAGRVVAAGGWRGIQGSAPADGYAVWIERIIQWLGDDPTPVVGVDGTSGVGAWLSDVGFTVAELDPATDSLAGVDVFVVTDRAEGGVDPVELAAIHTFLRDGGGLLASRDGLAAAAPIHATDEHRTAAAVAPAGIGWTWVARDAAGPDDLLELDPDPSPLHSLTRALETAARAQQGLQELDLDTWQAIRSQTATPGLANLDVPAHSRLAAAADALRRENGPLAISTDSPFRFGSGQLPDLLLRADYVVTGGAPSPGSPPHESHTGHPGTVDDDAPRIERRVTIDASAPLATRWRSTGLYAPPGEPIRIAGTPPEGAGLRVRVGATWLDPSPGVGGYDPAETGRFPRTWSARRLDGDDVALANPFGGPIFVVVPEGADAGDVEITIDGAAAMPRFQQGLTDDAGWNAEVDAAGVPVAELASDAFVVTGPAAVLGALSSAGEAIDQLHDIVAAAEDFVGLEAGARLAAEALPHRLVFDPVAPEGSGDGPAAGDPMWMAEGWAAGLLEPTLQLGNPGLWALLERIGLRYQRSVWTPGPWSAVTNKLLAVYAFEQATGLASTSAWQGTLTTVGREERRAAFFAGEASGWSASVEVKLDLFLLVRDSYGWEPFRSFFRTMRALPEADRPGDDQAKLDAWAVRLSRAAGVDFLGLFQAFRYPVSEAALASTEDLPAWDAWPRILPDPDPDPDPDPLR